MIITLIAQVVKIKDIINAEIVLIAAYVLLQ
jgi:hypothetical protein